MRPSTAALPGCGHEDDAGRMALRTGARDIGAMSTQPPSWAGAYVGIPYRDHGADRSGCDCWGLVRLVYRERARIDAAVLRRRLRRRGRQRGRRPLRRGRPRVRHLAARRPAAAGLRRRRDVLGPALAQRLVLPAAACRRRRRPGLAAAHRGRHRRAAGARSTTAALGKRIAGYWRHRRLDAGD